MDDCLPPGGATVQSPRYRISCVAMATKPACTHTAKLRMRVSGEISAKLHHTAVHNLSLGQRESRGEIHSVQLNARDG